MHGKQRRWSQWFSKNWPMGPWSRIEFWAHQKYPETDISAERGGEGNECNASGSHVGCSILEDSPNLSPQADGALDINSIFETLRKLEGPASIKVVKTWLNGWATSTRMHEDKDLGCLLGCRNQHDSLRHYIHCPHLSALQKFLFQDISEEPIIRFGIKDPSISFFQNYWLHLFCLPCTEG